MESVAIAENRKEKYKNMTYHYASTVADYERYFYSGYSLGVSKWSLVEKFEGFKSSLLAHWDKNCSYSGMLFALSMFIIYDMPRDEIKPVVDLLLKENYKDFVLDSMANFLFPEFEVRTESLKFNKSSKPVAEVIRLANSDKTKVTLKLKFYLEKQWLNMQKDGIIKNDNHQLEEDCLAYHGYWSIESAALVTMLGLDDTTILCCIAFADVGIKLKILSMLNGNTKRNSTTPHKA